MNYHQLALHCKTIIMNTNCTKTIAAVLLLFTAMCSACKKTDTTVIAQITTQTQYLTKSPWKLTGISFYYNGQWNAQQLTTFFQGYALYYNSNYSTSGVLSGTNYDGSTSFSYPYSMVDNTSITVTSAGQPQLWTLTKSIDANTLQMTHPINTTFSVPSANFTATGLMETFGH